jgi:hypothetical protein
MYALRMAKRKHEENKSNFYKAQLGKSEITKRVRDCSEPQVSRP